MEPKGQRLEKDEKDSPLADFLGNLRAACSPMNCVFPAPGQLAEAGTGASFTPLSFFSFAVPAQSECSVCAKIFLFSACGAGAAPSRLKAWTRRWDFAVWWYIGSAVKSMQGVHF